MRIKARAIRRCGVLLKEIEPAENDRERGADGRITRRGDTSPPGRYETAARVGMSRDQAKDAVRVANVPQDEFEEAVESDAPPTITGAGP